MKIDFLKVNGFGKLENRDFNFSQNINLIYGKNEAGKTTILKCISAIFYGLSKNKNGKEYTDFERYKPWGNSEFSGKMKYTLDSGKKIEVFRDFSKKNPKIFNENSEDISKEFNVDKSRGNEFFYEQTKIDEEMFLATGLVEQQKVELEGKEKDILTTKIANILTSGEGNISYKKAIENLNKDIIQRVGTDRTVGRPINIALEKRKKLSELKKSLQIKEERKEKIKQEKQEILVELEQDERDYKVLKELQKLKNEQNIEQEKIKVKKQIIDDYETKIKNLKIDEKENNSNLKVNITIILFFIIISIIAIILSKVVGGIIASLCIIGYIAFYLLNKRKQQSNKRAKEKEIKILENNKKEKQDDILKDNEHINKIFESKESELLKNISNSINRKNLTNNNSQNVGDELDLLEKKISTLKISLNTIEIEEKNINKLLEEKAEIEENLGKVEEEIEELQIEEKRLRLAKGILEKAYSKMKTEITPKLTANLSKIASKISNNKYRNIKFNDEEGLLVELENGEYINCNRLSIGTIDQLYLSLRLSVFQEITEEKVPIILDETFAYFDNERLKNILRYLNEEFKDSQILIFTCSNREKEILDNLEIKYNYIEL